MSQLHRAVAINVRTGRPECSALAVGARLEVFEFWSSDMLKLFRRAGMPRRSPPPLAAACTGDSGTDAPVIASPLRNVSYALRRSAPGDVISLEANVGGDVSRLFWFDGRSFIGAQAITDGALPWRPSTPGVHLIRAVDDRGRSAERDVEVSVTE